MMDEPQTIKANILVADDEPGILDVMNFFLSSEGYKTTLANNGQEAIELLKDQTFDCVITDVRMPKADGMAVLAAAKDLENPPPVIVMSGFSDLPCDEIINRGGWAYLTKPLDLDKLVEVIDSSLGRDKTQ
jgi:DNA-binding NtrC family response regulator